MFTFMALFSMNASACGIGEQVDGYENSDVKHAYMHWGAGDRSPVPFVFIDLFSPEAYAESPL